MHERIESLHALRGLAALLVAIGHSFYFPFYNAKQEWFGGRTLEEMTGGVTGAFRLYEIIPSGNYPVAVFFLLSGYVVDIALAKREPLSFLVGRVFRIYPTFLTAYALMFLTYVWLGRDLPDLKTIVSDMMLIGTHEVLNIAWTLLFEVRYYLIVGGLAFFGVSSIYRSWLILLAFVVTGNTTFFWLGFMALGALMSQASRTSGALTLVAGIVLWFFSAHVLHEWPPNQKAGNLVAALATMLLCMAYFRTSRIPQPLAFLGDISYPLYCLHPPIIMIVYYLLAGSVAAVLIQISPVIIAIGVAYIVHRAIETPSHQFGKDLSFKRQWS